MKFLTISGSLRDASSNSAVLDALPLLAPAGVEITRYRSLGDLPHFNPDLERDALPPSVAALRASVGKSDALILSSPEYAHGIAGSFKNMLDWLVGSLEFPGKPVAVINAAPRAHHAEQQLLEILRTMSATIFDDALLTLPVQGSRLDAVGIASTEALAAPLRAMLQKLIASITARAP